MIRIEIFQNTNLAAKGREFVAVLEVLERKENGKRSVSTCMNFFRTTASEAKQAALEFVRAEQERHAASKMTSKRTRKTA
jgi:hypothetical protein